MAPFPFPSPLELTAAAALLLLPSTPPSLSPPKMDSEGEPFREGRQSKEESLSLLSSGSKSCPSNLTGDVSSKEIRNDDLRVIAVAARCHELKFKAVRKSRSKAWYSLDKRDATSVKQAAKPPESVSADGSSCLTSSSSAISSARSGHETRGERGQTKNRGEVRKKRGGSAHMLNRAEAILKLLSGGCSSEMKIRRMLGDSPDTSKALRMLLKLEEVKRSGTGGRLDPYIYTIA